MIDLSSTFTYTTKSPPQVSPDGEFVGYVVGDKLVIRRTSTLATKKIVTLPRRFGIAEIAWDRSIAESLEQRLLARATNEIRTYAVDASGFAEASIVPGKFEVASAEWRSWQYEAEGQTDQIVRVVGFSRCGLRASVWSSDGLELDVPFVKFPRAIDIDGESFGILVRRKTQDELVVFSLKRLAESGQAVRKVVLKGMLDTKEIKCSPDGLYFCARDNAAIGFKVNIFGAEGTLVHVYEGPNAVRDEFDQGATVTEWTTTNGRTYLVIGDRNERIAIIDGRTFRSVAVLNHRDRIEDDVLVWIERISDSTNGVYTLAQLPFVVPSYKPDLLGVSLLEVSPDGKYLASRVDSMPSTIWVWSLGDTVQLHSVMCHSSYVHTVQWSKNSTKLLIIPTKGALVGVFSSEDERVPYLASFNKSMADISGGQWAGNDRFVVWDARNFAVASIPERAIEASGDGDLSMYDEPSKEQESTKRYELASPDGEFENVKREELGVKTDEEEGNDSGMSLEEELNNLSQENPEENGASAGSDDDLPMREGSPPQLQDDDTRIRDLVNGIQQNEWIEDPEDIKPDDTFHGRRSNHRRA